MINMNILNNSWLRTAFDGVDEYLNASNHSIQSNTGAGAIAVWINFNALPTAGTNDVNIFLGAGGLSDTGSGRALMLVGARTRTTWGNVRFDASFRATSGGSVYSASASTTGLTTGTRYLLVFQSTGSATEMYINGVSQTLSTPWSFGGMTGEWFGDATYSGTKTFRLGSSDIGSALINAKIDHFMIFNSNLTSTEITNLYNGGKAISPVAVGLASKLVNFYPLGENGSVSTYPDIYSGENFTGNNLESTDIESTNYY